MVIGALAQIVLGRGGQGIDWGMALGAGLIGSFVGGLLASLLAGDGLALKPSGLIGSFVGAVLVTLVWRWWQARNRTGAGAGPPPLTAPPADVLQLVDERRAGGVPADRCAPSRSAATR